MTITILTCADHGAAASKTWQADGSVLAFSAGAAMLPAQVRVANLQALSTLLSAIQHNPKMLVIRGIYRGDDNARAVAYKDGTGMTPNGPRKALVNYDDAPVQWMLVDIDNYVPPPGIDPVLDPVRAISAFIGAHLPSEFWGAGYHWQLSNSAGHPDKRYLLKAHVWFWLTEPRTSVELLTWARAIDPNKRTDHRMFNAVQAHYTSLPKFAPSMVDPVPVRCGMVIGHDVALRMPDGIAVPAYKDGDDRFAVTDPRTKPGVIGAFCRAYSPHSILTGTLSAYFEHDHDNRYTWLKSDSGAREGVFITETELHVVNTHNSDPCGNRKTNTFDLVRVHCFGHLDHAPGVEPFALLSPRTTPSHQAMCGWAMGHDPVREAMAAAQAVSGGGRSAFSFIRARDLLTKPEPIPQLIHELFESGSLAQLFGKSGSAKSFLAIDWACCVATGKEWCGRKVTQGAVFYIAGEGHSGIRKRLKVWEQHHATPLADAPLFVSNAPAALMDATNAANVAREVEVLATEHGAPVLIIVDTLARNLGAGEENSNADIGLFINNLDILLRTRFGATVLIVHHTGHGEQERSRGASSLRAAMDHEYRLEDKGGIRELSCTKAKESEPPPLMTFRLLPVTLSGWTNENGEFITSAVLVPTTDKPVANLLELTGANQVALRALGNAILEFGVVPDPNLFTGCSNRPFGKVVREEVWRQRAYDEGISDGEQDAKKKAFGRSRKALIDKNLIATWKDFYWPVSMPGHGTLPGHSGTLSRAQGDRPGHTSIDVSRCPAPVA